MEMKLIHFLVLFGLASRGICQCPTDCTCPRAKVVNCSPGLSAFPSNLSGDVNILFVSGKYKIPNNIPSIQKNDFQSMPEMVMLKMAHCEISTIADDTFLSQKSLRYLDLSHNNIPKINDKIFAGLIDLITLQISGNPHCEISETAFDGLSNLQELFIAELDLVRLFPGMFANMKHLRVLDVHGNNIWKIEFDVWTVFSSLLHLDVSNNLLEGFPKFNEDSNTTVKMSGNPLQCNCELRWLKHEPEKFYESEYANDILVCAGPERLKHAPILLVSAAEFKCLPPEIIKCTPETYVVMETAPLRMSCELAGDPYPDVTWTRFDGKHLEFTYENISNYYVSKTGTLEIFNVSQADEGTWSLNVRNTVGQKSHQLRVVVTPKTTTTTTTTMTTATTATTPLTTTSTTQPTKAMASLETTKETASNISSTTSGKMTSTTSTHYATTQSLTTGPSVLMKTTRDASTSALASLTTDDTKVGIVIASIFGGILIAVAIAEPGQ
ncbi:leucine-rich repeat and fibronectin type III domain-containing protein 1-like protein [Argopecten irradians]|uniref:leucine-rich repeat and fibronectin type III domain-containing protein 1-like protein n=1 Tax=Argopecten irradians TaxID=31199 RepID=UPI003723F1DB